MRRFSTIMGTVVICALFVIWNHLMSGDTYTGRQDVQTLPVQLSYNYLIGAVLFWYALNWLHAIKEWNRRPVLRFGRYVRTMGPGLCMLEPLFHDTLDDIPVQDVVVNIPVPNIQTMDNVGVGVEAVLTYRVDEAKVKDAVVEVEDVSSAVPQRALSTMNDIGSVTGLNQFLEHRAQFGIAVVEKLKERVAKWGVTIQALELKSFKINDPEIEKAIAMKARAEKEAAAELTRAEMQSKIAAKLNEAATTYNDQGKWLKELEVLIELCRSANNNTILLPTNLQGSLGALSGMLPKVADAAKVAVSA